MSDRMPTGLKWLFGVLALACLLFWVGAFYMANFGRGMPLAVAAERGDLPEVKRILERRPDWINSNPDGSSPLHYAAAAGRLEVVKYLIEQGADPGRPNEANATAGQMARAHGHEEVADYLKAVLERKKSGDGAP